MEHGFWDYTCHAAGGMEWFEKDDYLLLLDDMAAAGMDSLVIVVRWNTIGYRSRLPHMGRLTANPVIDSDNELLRFVIAEARKRAIKVRMSAFVLAFEPETFGGTPFRVSTLEVPGHGKYSIGVYDVDHPGVCEQAAMIFTELVELFPGIDGLVVEVEDGGVETPRRAAMYNKWAEENGRRPINEIGRPFNPRFFDVPEWRDYTTHSRLNMMKSIEQSVRAAGFAGDFGMICETAAGRYSVCQEVNLRHYKQALPDWFAVTYEYNKSWHRYAMMDFCIAQPKQDGLKVFYLPRGVMTWLPADVTPRNRLPVPLEESWEMDVEDIRMFRPDGVWWFGCGTKSDGVHVSESLLREMGFEDGVSARRALLRTAAALRENAK